MRKEAREFPHLHSRSALSTQHLSNPLRSVIMMFERRERVKNVSEEKELGVARILADGEFRACQPTPSAQA
jgi:hypothetical protein